MPSAKLQSFPGAPTFAWIVANRVTDPYQDLDCVIFIIGRKRSGKSTNAIGLAEEIAGEIAKIRGGAASDYFTVDTNVVSVQRHGGLDLMTSDRIIRQNNVFVIDDAKISLSNRKHASPENQLQNDIITICGPFRPVIIFTAVFKKTVDVGTRELADFIIKIESTNAFTKQTTMRIYFYETNDDGNEYKKYLRWTDPKTGIRYRMKYFFGTLPSEEANKAYKKMRKDNSRDLIVQARSQYEEISKRQFEVRLTPTEIRQKWIEDNRDEVQRRKSNGHSIRKIARDLGKPPTTIEKCLTKVVTDGPKQ